MSKFNKDKLRGISAIEEDRVKVGQGLLNKDGQDSMLKVSYIPRDQIKKNDKNEYSIENIESLAWNIHTVGLLQPLHVARCAEGYKLLGGERRLTAIDMLIANPEIKEYNENSLIPCVVKDPDTIDLKLSDDAKEKLAIMSTNKEARKYTDGDTLLEIRNWEEIIEELRQNGVESISLPGSKWTGELQIKGEKTRDIVSRAAGISRGTVNKFKKIENQGSKDVIDALLSNQIDVNTAESLVDNLDHKEQAEVIQEVNEGSPKDVKEDIRQKIKDKQTLKAEGCQDEETDGTKVTAKSFKADIVTITKALKNRDVYLDETQLMNYYSHIRELEKLFTGEKE